MICGVNQFDLPQLAIDAFEKTTHLRITIHAVDSKIWSMLPPALHSHVTPACSVVKTMGDELCRSFDQQQVRQELARRPEGFVKICHAGLVEWVTAASSRDAMPAPRLILFAGQARPGRDLKKVEPVTTPLAGMKMHLPDLPVVDASQAMTLLEMLRQLGARFEQWLHQLEGQPPELSQKLGPADRRRWIEAYIQGHHTRDIDIADVARRLGVSPGRAAHIVSEVCGRSFGSLLADARVRTAASLLTYTHLSVLEIAMRSGFGDVSNFHRRFKERLNLSPLQYRKRAEVFTPVTVEGQTTRGESKSDM